MRGRQSCGLALLHPAFPVLFFFGSCGLLSGLSHDQAGGREGSYPIKSGHVSFRFFESSIQWGEVIFATLCRGFKASVFRRGCRGRGGLAGKSLGLSVSHAGLD